MHFVQKHIPLHHTHNDCHMKKTTKNNTDSCKHRKPSKFFFDILFFLRERLTLTPALQFEEPTTGRLTFFNSFDVVAPGLWGLCVKLMTRKSGTHENMGTATERTDRQLPTGEWGWGWGF